MKFRRRENGEKFPSIFGFHLGLEFLDPLEAAAARTERMLFLAALAEISLRVRVLCFASNWW